MPNSQNSCHLHEIHVILRHKPGFKAIWIKIKSIEKTFIKIGGKAGSSPLGLNLNPNSWKRARMDMDNNLIQIAVKPGSSLGL